MDESKLPFTAIPGATAYYGVLSGCGVPRRGTRELERRASSFRPTVTAGPAPSSPSTPPLGTLLIALGFAWAASSYRRNGYDVGLGRASTHALVNRLNGRTGSRRRSTSPGASLGGHITAVAIEQYRNVFAGAMPICGVLADSDLFDYFLDFNATAPQLGTGGRCSPWTRSRPSRSQFRGSGRSCLGSRVGGRPADRGGQDLTDVVERRSGGERPGFDEAWFSGIPSRPSARDPICFLFGLDPGVGTLRRGPGVADDNSDVVYQFDGDPGAPPAEEQAFNDGVVRVSGGSAGESRWLAAVPRVDGASPCRC